MSPKIVKKEVKREELALCALDFIIEFGIDKFSTAAFIKYLGIGKSSLYHYFESKEEILYEAFYIITLKYIKECELKLKNGLTLKEKLEIIYEFYLVDSADNIWFRKFYLEYLKIFVNSHTETMKNYNNSLMSMYKNLFKMVFDNELKNNRIKVESLNLINTMITTADGMLVYSFSIDNFDLSKELTNYIDTLIFLIEIKD